jgi:hypothetical protein
VATRSSRCVSTTTEIGDVWTEIFPYGTAVQAVPVTDAAKYTASQVGYGGSAPQH